MVAAPVRVKGVTGSCDGAARVWELRTGSMMVCVSNCIVSVGAAALSADASDARRGERKLDCGECVGGDGLDVLWCVGSGLVSLEMWLGL